VTEVGGDGIDASGGQTRLFVGRVHLRLSEVTHFLKIKLRSRVGRIIEGESPIVIQQQSLATPGRW
jgi:hypothetical protein